MLSTFSNHDYKYGVYRKHDDRPIIKTRTKEEAEKLVKYNFAECEVKPLWNTLEPEKEF